MAASRERRLSVELYGRRVGLLHAREDTTWFVLDPDYLEDSERAVLGLRFEEDPKARHRANMRLPPWFSNLLPEGRLRKWIAETRGVRVERELELLTQVGADLPGAVTVVPTDAEVSVRTEREVVAAGPEPTGTRWRFSLAGVQMKFSMLRSGERFSAPVTTEGGDWIAKLPDLQFPHVPRNEFAMMSLAREVGIEVPETRLVHRDLIDSIPDRLWPGREHYAYAVRRFDRGPGGARIHMEDFAQVRGFYPDDHEKYRGSYETVAAHVYRRHDLASLRELVRRLAFIVLIRNGDGHLKNWSLLYRDRRVPALSPAYDLVATGVYAGENDEELALKFCGSRRFEDVTLSSFDALERRLGLRGEGFAEIAKGVAERSLESFAQIEENLAETGLLDRIRESVRRSVRALLR